MAAPTEDFLNQAVGEVIATLKASADFVSPDFIDQEGDEEDEGGGEEEGEVEPYAVPEDACGVIVYIEDRLPPCEEIPDHRLPHCGVAYLGDDPNIADSAASDTAYTINLGLRLYHRGTNRRKVWRELMRACAVIAKIVAYEMSPEGSNFNGFAENARYIGGVAIDTREQSGFGALLPVRIALEISRPDY
jgi:hypothetical protein